MGVVFCVCGCGCACLCVCVGGCVCACMDVCTQRFMVHFVVCLFIYCQKSKLRALNRMTCYCREGILCKHLHKKIIHYLFLVTNP